MALRAVTKGRAVMVLVTTQLSDIMLSAFKGGGGEEEWPA